MRTEEQRVRDREYYERRRQDPTYMAKARERAAKWRAENPERHRASVKRWAKEHPQKYGATQLRHKRKRYGNLPAYEHLGVCEACEKPFKHAKDAQSDHDHASGKWRGWLCIRCNMREGMLNTLFGGRVLEAFDAGWIVGDLYVQICRYLRRKATDARP